MKSWRLLAATLAIDDVDVPVAYADVYVVLREGHDEPGPNDWEATVSTIEHQHLAPGIYTLSVRTPDELVMRGSAVLRFSDGRRHLFRGDGLLVGVIAAIA